MAKKSQDEQQKPGMKDKLRAKNVWIDRVFKMLDHYKSVRGNNLAAAVTYFGFLSLFPVLALAFAILAYVVRVYPEAQTQAIAWLNSTLPGITDAGLDLEKIATDGAAAKGASIVGAIGLLYSGLGWLDSMREALRQMWAVAPQESNIVKQKLTDVFVLALLGGAVVGSLAISGIATGLTDQVLEWVHLEGNAVASVFVVALGVLLSIASTMLVLVVLFARLPGHRLPRKNVYSGALLGAVLIAVLQQVGSILLSRTVSSNAALGIVSVALGLLVYINFASKIVMYAAAWCVVAPIDTLESSLAAKGETLSQSEAEATSDAREQHGDDEPVGKRHSTSAGKVPVTTTGVAGEEGSEGVDLREKTKSAAKEIVSKGSVLSFVGVIALVVLRGKSRKQ